MPTCPTCFETYASDASTCPADGTALVPDGTFAKVDRDVLEGTAVGEYQIVAKLGEGGFGAVYRAEHPLIGKMAAVKVLSRQFSSNPQMVSRFIAEARAVNQIRHRNIIDIFSFGQLADGRQYYIMELLEGESFDAYLARKERLTLAEAMPILRGIARALDAAHAKNILHRDLKPENVYLVFDEEGRALPKLLDFGLVKLMASTSSHKTKTGTPMGTPYYMSPEQCRGLDADARTDVYSFGALVFEVLTGDVPFDGESTMDILVKHMTALPPSASERCPEVPAALDVPLARLLAKEPKDRPARVGESLDLLAMAIGLEVPAPVASSRRLGEASGAEQHETATTMLADAPPTTVREGAAATHTKPAHVAPAIGQTFLGAETDVAPPPRARSRFLLVAVVGLIMAGVGAAAVVAVMVKKPVPTAQANSATGIVAQASVPSAQMPASVSANLPAQQPVEKDEVEVKVAGAPEGAVVSANGIELGTAPGPFKLKSGVAVKLTFAAKGYRPKEITITPTENVLLPVSMDKIPNAPVGGGRRPNSGGIHSDLEGFDNKK